MKKSCYSDSQILAILKQVEGGTPVPQLCREHGMSSATFYKWRAKYGGMNTSMIESGACGVRLGHGVSSHNPTMLECEN